jgi:hypothetical protein
VLGFFSLWVIYGTLVVHVLQLGFEKVSTVIMNQLYQ